MNHDRENKIGGQDFFSWRSQATNPNMSPIGEDDLVADVDEPPDHRSKHAEFSKSTVRIQTDQKVSLLTRALKSPEADTYNKPDISVNTDMSRRRSMVSNTSLASASTAELTSDGGLTSPARTDTPSPTFPNTTYTSFAPFSMTKKSVVEPVIAGHLDVVDMSPRPAPTPVEAPPKKRCITFACGLKKAAVQPAAKPVTQTTEAPKRPSAIKFACTAKPSERLSEKSKFQPPSTPVTKTAEPQKRPSSRSPSMTRRSRPQVSSGKPQIQRRESTSTVRRASLCTIAIRAKPKFLSADEKTLQASEATRFHEFASDELQDDDWIRKDMENPKERLTINDTLKMENAIRRLGSEVEEEALDEDDEEDSDGQGNDSDDELNSQISQDEDEDDEDDQSDASADDASDGNESDNEQGFAESDEESDGEGNEWWTPGNYLITHSQAIHRPSLHRTASASSIDSLHHMSPRDANGRLRRPKRSRHIKILPGTPELPDSTDFVCGTLDEDRPIEDAYVSCMNQRKNARHVSKPQDIDPSFPTSDPEEEEEDENDDYVKAGESDEEPEWMHDQFEDSAEDRHTELRSSAIHRRSPNRSPRRLHSPPPPKRLHSPPPPRRLHSPPPPTKGRLRSPPPRKLFGHSPKRMHSPPPARAITSPPASPLNEAVSRTMNFAPLGSRPGLTHTKSLPRTPNVFCRQYQDACITAPNGIDGNNAGDGHVRGAIDIITGLEQKRQRRREKFKEKHCNRARKAPERKPQPGKGAERMREIGLLMAGLKPTQDPYMLSA